MNLPNKLSLIRILLIPVIIIVYSIEPLRNQMLFDGAFHLSVCNAIILVLAVAGALTDLFDGKYARKHNLVTDLGKFLDPLADKLLVVTLLVIVYDQCNYDQLESRVSRKANLCVLIPKSSNFTNVNSSPEYLINFKQNSLSELIEYQEKAIEEVSKQVLIGGTLVYLTYTLNKKENDLVVQKFLESHPGWHLVEQKTCFPNSTEVTCGYYAILHREL